MSRKSTYFVIAELYRTGFIIGDFDSLRRAKMEYERICNLSWLYEFHEIAKLSLHLSRYRTYEIRGEEYISGYMLPISGSNGAFSVYVLSTGSDNRDAFIDHFVTVREFQTELFIYEEIPSRMK